MSPKTPLENLPRPTEFFPTPKAVILYDVQNLCSCLSVGVPLPEPQLLRLFLLVKSLTLCKSRPCCTIQTRSKIPQRCI